MFKKILIPVDVAAEDETRKLLMAGKDLATSWGSEVHVMSVVPDFGTALVGSYFDKDFENKSRTIAETALSEAIAVSGLDAQPHIAIGTIYDRVIALASELAVDLIVIGAHRPELKDYLLGSNAARVVRHSTQSVMVLRD